ncbi:MAG: ABC transporter permease subunit [Candidatus Thermoplasmatota archaeon]
MSELRDRRSFRRDFTLNSMLLSLSLFAIAKRELLYSLKSIRMLVMVVLFALAVIGGAYGFGILSFHPELIPQANLSSFLAQRNPDTILYLSGMFVALVGTVFAIVLSFDSVAKERIQHSIEFLICRPITKSNIIIGKFLGVLTALAIPVTAISLFAMLAIWRAIGLFPSFKMALGFVTLTIILLAIFIAIQLAFSSLAKSLGTAIVFGIGIWFLFATFFWALVPLSTAYALNIPVESPEYNILRSKIDILSPVGSYDLALGILANSAVGITPTLHYSLPFISLILWLVIPLWCSTEIFKRIEY